MMNENDFSKFKEKGELILNGLKQNGINFEVTETPIEDAPCYFVRFKDGNLKRWFMGIWATGEWSDYYALDEESGITVFLIHDWSFDKWRPSSADMVWFFLPDSSYFGNFTKDLLEIRKSPIKSYGEIFFLNHHPDYLWPFLYFKDWFYNVIFTPLKYKLKNVWLPWVLFLTLLFIALFDKRVKKVSVFKERDCNSFSYTFSFLANEKCSESDRRFWKFYRLYSLFPDKLNRKTKGLFNARWNVADYRPEMKKSEVRSRMLKGIIQVNPNKNYEI